MLDICLTLPSVSLTSVDTLMGPVQAHALCYMHRLEFLANAFLENSQSQAASADLSELTQVSTSALLMDHPYTESDINHLCAVEILRDVFPLSPTTSTDPFFGFSDKIEDSLFQELDEPLFTPDSGIDS